MANPNLKAKYTAEVAPALMQKFGYKSTMQIPRLEKIVVNVGCSEARENAKVLDAVVNDLTTITGQKAIITKAKKSVANFKLREGMPIGAKVTLRGDKMWEFLDRSFEPQRAACLPESLLHTRYLDVLRHRADTHPPYHVVTPIDAGPAPQLAAAGTAAATLGPQLPLPVHAPLRQDCSSSAPDA